MKTTITVVQVLLGLFLLYASLTYFFEIEKQPAPPSNEMKVVMAGLVASGFLLPLVKIIELIVGISLISNRYVTLSSLVLFPVSFTILLLNIFLMPENIIMGLILFLGNLLLIYVYRANYKSIFRP